MTIRIGTRQILAKPRTKRFGYYVYGEALSNRSSIVNDVSENNSSGGNTSKGDYISLNGEDIEGSSYTYSDGNMNLNSDFTFGIGVRSGINGVYITDSIEFGDEEDSATVKAGFVAVDNGGNLQRLCIGWGEDPSKTTNCLAISENALKWKERDVFNAGESAIPNENERFDLGSLARKWRNLYGTYFSGNSETATKWVKPINLTLTGSISGTASIDGSEDITIRTNGGAVAYWGQFPDSYGEVKGTQYLVEGMYWGRSGTGVPYDIGTTAERYNRFYARQGYFGNTNYGDGSGKNQGISIDGENTSIYMFGSPTEEGIRGARITSVWKAGTNTSATGSLGEAGPGTWYITRKLWVGRASENGRYDNEHNNMVNSDYTIYGYTVACNTFVELSDRKIKSNIKEIREVDLSSIKTYSYTVKDEEGNESPKIGVMAQEVQDVYPELIRGEDVLSVNYNGLVALLIAEVNSLKKQVSFLQEEINGLKK